jgi:hypothetical protein
MIQSNLGSCPDAQHNFIIIFEMDDGGFFARALACTRCGRGITHCWTSEQFKTQCLNPKQEQA